MKYHKIPRHLQKLLVLLFFAAVLLIGCRIFQDYGVSWDEKIDRRSGSYSLHAIVSTFMPEVLPDLPEEWGHDRFYGQGIQHIFLAVELITGVNIAPTYGSPEIWSTRHLVSWLIVWLSLCFLYLSGRILWQNRLKALMPAVLYLMIPRFFAESFYNSKDIGALAFISIGGYFLLRFMRRPTALNAIIAAVAAAIAASTRLSAVELLLAVAGFWTVNGLLRNTGTLRIKKLLFLPVILAVFAAVLYIVYPASWHDPLGFFQGAIQIMTKHPWRGAVRFCGKDIRADLLPFYYLPLWMAITLPLPVILLTFTGTAAVIKALIRRGLHRFKEWAALLWAGLFWLAMAVVTLSSPTVYNGWRQFYFLAWPMLFLAAEGLFVIWRLAGKIRFARILCLIAAAGWITLHLCWMINAHPYQYLYFNCLAVDPENNFEQDYWQVSNANAMREIVREAAEAGKPLRIGFNQTSLTALSMLTPEEAEWISIVPVDKDFDRYIFFNSYDWPEKAGLQRLADEIPGQHRLTGCKTRRVPNSIFTGGTVVYRILYFTAPGNGETAK